MRSVLDKVRVIVDKVPKKNFPAELGQSIETTRLLRTACGTHPPTHSAGPTHPPTHHGRGLW